MHHLIPADAVGSEDHRNSELLLPVLVHAIEEALPSRIATILTLRFGLVNGEGQTLAEVGVEMGVSRERIRQLVDRGIRTLRRRGAEGELGPSFILIDRVETEVRPDEPGVTVRCSDLAANELAHLSLNSAAWLLLSLAGVRGWRRTHLIAGVTSYVRVEQTRGRSVEAERRRLRKFDDLVNSAFWPRHMDERDAPPLQAARRPRLSEERGGHFTSEKLGRSVEFESQLERSFLCEAETLASVRTYQEQPLAIEYEFGDRVRIYYPDVLLVLADGRVLVVELKPRFQMALSENLAKWRAAIRFCHAHGWGFLVTDGARSLRSYLERELDEALADQVVAAASEAGGIDWATYEVIRTASAIPTEDFLAVVLQRRLEWSLAPFLLRAPNCA